VTTLCHPGNHPVDLTYHGARWAVCSPDVPGSGLPWDMPTALCAIGALLILGGFAAYLGYLMYTDRKRIEP
jgi:hypothetical protein